MRLRTDGLFGGRRTSAVLRRLRDRVPGFNAFRIGAQADASGLLMTARSRVPQGRWENANNNKAKQPEKSSAFETDLETKTSVAVESDIDDVCTGGASGLGGDEWRLSLSRPLSPSTALTTLAGTSKARQERLQWPKELESEQVSSAATSPLTPSTTGGATSNATSVNVLPSLPSSRSGRGTSASSCSGAAPSPPPPRRAPRPPVKPPVRKAGTESIAEIFSSSTQGLGGHAAAELQQQSGDCKLGVDTADARGVVKRVASSLRSPTNSIPKVRAFCFVAVDRVGMLHGKRSCLRRMYGPYYSLLKLCCDRQILAGAVVESLKS